MGISLNEQQIPLQKKVLATSSGKTLNDQNACSSNRTTFKLENLRCQNEILLATVNKLNDRVGDELISDSDSDGLSDLCDENVNPNVNTLHFQRDGSFAAKYFFITDVSFFLTQLFLHKY